MNIQPMPREWHQHAPPQAKRARLATLRRHIATLAQPRDPDAGRHLYELGQELGVFCTVPGCVGAHHGRGLCLPHLKRTQGDA